MKSAWGLLYFIQLRVAIHPIFFFFFAVEQKMGLFVQFNLILFNAIAIQTALGVCVFKANKALL